ncbi:MAG: HEAT repeat domain-containing protein [Gemmatimonadota bacterium]
MPAIGLAARLTLTTALLLPVHLHAQQRSSSTNLDALQRLLVAEDARGTGEAGLAPLLEGIRSSDSLLRRVAVRGIGRLQRPDLARLLLPALNDPLPSVRAEAANAMVQGLKRVRRGAPVVDTLQLSTRIAFDAIVAALAREATPAAIDALAEALGRLPFADTVEVRAAESAMRTRSGAILSIGIVHGMYSLALAQSRRAPGGLSPDGVQLLRRASVSAAPPEVRRLAVLALGLIGGLDSSTTRVALKEGDEQVRRLALAGAASLALGERTAAVTHALADPSPIVRVAAVGAWRALQATPACNPLIALATRDVHPWVRLIAIDSLGAPCTDSAAVRAALAGIVDRPGAPADAHGWQAPARALEALAHIDAAAARARLARYLASRRWQERVTAGHAAATIGDDAALYPLAHDGDQNVREAAVAGLAALKKHAADTVYLAALSSPGFQVVLAAATALSGTTAERALPTLLDAFDRVSAERSENARDPRVAMLRRIGELGSASTVERMTPYLADFDSTIATMTATLLTRWSGKPATARPAPLPIHPEPLAQLFMTKGVQLRVTLNAASGGGSFIIALFPDEAPATAARLIRLAREGFYAGGILQRVEPNFVVQGGGPGATEYIGDSTFMRDELTGRTQARGTIGISARGRDTGDAQLYVNVVDNPLLDHEYTVAGVIVSGRAVSERIMDGDVIAKVEVLGFTPR